MWWLLWRKLLVHTVICTYTKHGWLLVDRARVIWFPPGNNELRFHHVIKTLSADLLDNVCFQHTTAVSRQFLSYITNSNAYASSGVHSVWSWPLWWMYFWNRWFMAVQYCTKWVAPRMFSMTARWQWQWLLLCNSLNLIHTIYKVTILVKQIIMIALLRWFD